MIPRILAGLLVAGCVTAAAGGAYVAIRQNAAAETSQTAPAASVKTAPAAPAPTAEAVDETEAVVARPSPVIPPVTAPPPVMDGPAHHEAPPPVRPAKPAPVQAQAPRSNPVAGTAATRTEAANPRVPGTPAQTGSPTTQATAPVPSAERSGTDTAAVSAAVEPAPEPSRASEPLPAPAESRSEEVVLPASSVIGLQVTTPLSSERTRIEDRVDARVTRDVTSAGRVAIPEGSRVIGAVTLVERGGKMKERARLGVRFHTLVLADGSEVPLRTEPIYREGESPAGDSARKIGGAAIGGAILGAIMGGGKGAVIGGATGAAGGSAAVMAGDRNAATLPGGTVVTVRLLAPATIEVQKREQ
jgi:hypothetical protein